ncbi:MAG: zinc-ribbon domain-containing protein [Wolbachia sp.]|nr:zinc-ribbon domain-containing protein [Wolbachia sp.]MDD9335893.1 zinc-ribbon domain-containing protein [Wolbachia sp.]
MQCQNCTKTYLVYPDQIGKSGRKVKCANCHHLQESSNNLCIANIQEREAGNRSFLRSLAFTTATLTATTTLCFIMADNIFPNEIKKVYKTMNTYKNSINYKLGYKKEK